jgi:hypothetical protein
MVILGQDSGYLPLLLTLSLPFFTYRYLICDLKNSKYAIICALLQAKSRRVNRLTRFPSFVVLQEGAGLQFPPQKEDEAAPEENQGFRFFF